MNKKRNIIITSIIVFILIASGLFYAFKSINNKTSSTVEKKLYGKISKIEDDYALITDLESNDEVKIKIDKDMQEGDILVIYYVNSDNKIITPIKKEILLTNTDNEIKVIDTKEEVVETTTTAITTTKVTSTVRNTTSNTTTTKVNNETFEKIKEDLVNTLKSDYEKVKSGEIKEEFKTSLINVIDFIFYGTSINGVTFNDLSASAKAKVIYYTLLIDSKLDAKFPNYKATINGKYDNIKSKLIAKYLDITTSICDNNKELCSDLKSDFKLLKNSLSLTWDFVKAALSYATSKGTSAIKTWYEAFSGK